MNIKLLKSSIGAVLGEFGFKNGKGGSFYLPCADVTLVVGLRKSTYGDCCYLDCGINILRPSGDVVPKVIDCHIQFNFNILVDGEESIVAKALDMRSAQAEDVEDLASLIRRQGAPNFLKMSSLAALRHLYRRGELGGVLLLKLGREILEKA